LKFVWHVQSSFTLAGHSDGVIYYEEQYIYLQARGTSPTRFLCLKARVRVRGGERYVILPIAPGRKQDFDSKMFNQDSLALPSDHPFLSEGDLIDHYRRLITKTLVDRLTTQKLCTNAKLTVSMPVGVWGVMFDCMGKMTATSTSLFIDLPFNSPDCKEVFRSWRDLGYGDYPHKVSGAKIDYFDFNKQHRWVPPKV
jgi:hypothetical protein